VEATETVAGKGLSGRWRGRAMFLGNREFVAHGEEFAQVPLPPPVEKASETWIAGPGLLARLILKDALRSNSKAVVGRLRAAGLRTVMLTGDRLAPAQEMGAASGVDEVRAALKPEDKVSAIREFQHQGKGVAMIGDGVNDAPCLVAADVGIAMGARGSDAAIEQAEVVLANDRLENFLFARELSVRSRRIIRQNITLSLGTILVMAVVSLTYSRLPLSVGVAVHEGSTVLVVLNSLRLLRARSVDPG
jgi:Cd2+/Zn2+-exporting ATPase